MKAENSLRPCSKCGKVCVQAFDGLVAVHYLSVTLLDEGTKLSDDSHINRQSSLQADKVNPRVAKLFFQLSPAGRHHREVQTVGGVPANIQRQHLHASAV